MKEAGGGLRHFIIAFLLAIILYAVTFYFIEHRRSAKGPWDVSFVSESGSPPEIVINQHSLGITNVRILFEGVLTNEMRQALRFDKARPVPFPVPFGECIFQDATFLPGTVTLRCFGHELEMIPRVLIIDHRERQWSEKVCRVP